jgi:hypothetical protein
VSFKVVWPEDIRLSRINLSVVGNYVLSYIIYRVSSEKVLMALRIK